MVSSATLMRYERYLLALLICMHLAGLVGLNLGYTKPYFILLTPFNLIMTALVLCCFQIAAKQFDPAPLLLIAVLGIVVEIVGVQTGVLFGKYEYGSTLGYKLVGVPILIGANWAILISSTATLARNVQNRWVRAVAGATLMLFIDFFIEPVAMNLDFWQWDGNKVPVVNYIGWFVTSLFFHILYERLSKHRQTVSVGYIYIVQLVFFLTSTLMIEFF